MNTPPGHTTDLPIGERKQITAVFVDLVGFSDIASTADPEDLQQWLEDYYVQSRDIIESYSGEVTEYLGDGIVALFGLARADELAAEKAVTAALKSVGEINARNAGGIRLQLRAGIATGEVAVRAADGLGAMPRATGMVTTLAQRIQEKAAPGTVMLAESTQILLRGTRRLKKFPDTQLKGFSDPHTLYQPVTAGRLDGHAPDVFIGRIAELKKIADSREPSLLIGPAGIGKTALARHVAKTTSHATTFSANGVYTQASYQPFKDWILRQIGQPLPNFGDIQSQFGSLDASAQRVLALLLGLPEGQRLLVEQTNLALRPLIETTIWQAVQSVQPDGILIFEDLHWLDNASLSTLVNILLDPAAGRYSILMTSREDTKIGKYLGNLPVNLIALDVLQDADAAGLIDALSAGNITPEERTALLETAAGVPLFLEQLFKRRNATAKNHVPGSLMDLLAEQIDASGPAKPALQCGAIIGRQFSRRMLAALIAEGTDLDELLGVACANGVLKQHGADDWEFSHALLHQAAYQGMLRKTRIGYHGQIAQHLQDHHADAVLRDPVLLTDHLRLAQQYVPAIQNYLTVSQWALFQGAFEDAEAHILAALTLCDEAPEDIDVTDLRIACQTALGSTRMQTQGFTAEPVREAFEAVARLATARGGHSAANGPAFFGSFSHAILSGDKDGSERFRDLLVETAGAINPTETNQEVQLAALNTEICYNFYAGHFTDQFSGFAQLRGIYDISRHGAMIAKFGMDSFAAAQMFEPVGRAISGHTHLVEELVAETDAHQALLNIPVMLPYAEIWGAVPLFYAGHHDRARARLNQGLATAHAQSAAFWQVTGAAWLHVMDPEQSDSDNGLAQFEQVLNTHEAIGSRVGLPYFRAHYAQALLRNGKHDAALRCARQAINESTASELYCWHAEVLRLSADVYDRLRLLDDATDTLDRAATFAASQAAGLWLLRIRIDQYRTNRTDRATLTAALSSLPAAADPPEVTIAKTLLTTP